MSTRVMLVCGTGGVGKTTVAAALGIAHALQGRRVCVLTIDPARRLADALGVSDLDNEPRAVQLEGLPAGARLDAMMLDRKATWDATIRRMAPDADTAERLLANRYYEAVSTRLSGSHEYMASEKLHELVVSDKWDVVVVDTPPAQHALEFFSAPERVERLFDHRVLGALANPSGSLLGAATRRVLKILASLVGEGVMDEIAEFFRLISSVAQAFRDHSSTIAEVLRSEATAIYLVTSAASRSRAGALEFMEVLVQQDRRLAGLVVNRVVAPPPGPDVELASLPLCPPEAEWREAWEVLLSERRRLTAIASRHARAITSLHASTPTSRLWALPRLDDGAQTRDALLRLAAALQPLEDPETTTDPAGQLK